MKVTFPAALFLVFLSLKLTGYIDWSWWWVTAPMWVPLAVGLTCYAFYGVLLLFETPEQKAARKLRDLAAALKRR